MHIVKWQKGGKTLYKKVSVTKWKNLCFFTNNIFFLHIFNLTRLVRTVNATEKYLNITKFVCTYLKLMSIVLQNSNDFLSFWTHLKNSKRKKVSLFSEQFLGCDWAKIHIFLVFFLLVCVVFSPLTLDKKNATPS